MELREEIYPNILIFTCSNSCKKFSLLIPATFFDGQNAYSNIIETLFYRKTSPVLVWDYSKLGFQIRAIG